MDDVGQQCAGDDTREHAPAEHVGAPAWVLAITVAHEVDDVDSRLTPDAAAMFRKPPVKKPAGSSPQSCVNKNSRQLADQAMITV